MTATARRHPLASLPRPFAVFLSGLGVSKLGDALFTFALPWIAYELTKSPVLMGALYATEILPVLLLGAFVGVWLDRVDRRRLMMTTDVLRALLVALIPLLHLLGVLAVWHLFVVALLLALLSLAFDVTTQAVVPQLAGPDLTRANAAHQLVMQLGGMAGPALAGVAIAALGGYGAMWLNAVSFAGTFLALLALPQIRTTVSGRGAASVLQGIGEGFRWMWGHAVIRTLSLQAAVGNFGFGMVSATLMFYLVDTLDLGARVAGLNYAMLGVGGVLGSLAIVPLARRFRRGALYPAILTFGLLGLLLMTVRSAWTPGVGFGMVAACNVAWVVLSTSVRQEQIPEALFGRVLSFTRMLSTAAMPLGATLGGVMMAHLDPAWVFVTAAACKGVEVLVTRFSAMRTL